MEFGLYLAGNHIPDR